MVQVWTYTDRSTPDCPLCRMNDRVIYKESFGPHRTQRYFCKRCDKSFSERTGKFLYRMRITEDEALRVLTLYGFGSSPTRIQTKLGLNRRTVVRVLDRAGLYPGEVREMLREKAGFGIVTVQWLSFMFEARVTGMSLPVDLNDPAKRRLGTKKALTRDGADEYQFPFI
jgi:transposase-like protein